jgi:hypothetical protein
MEDLSIDKNKLYALEIIGELEDIYISKISQDDSELNRQKLEPLRKSINFIRDEYKLDDKAEYLYSQYIKGLRYSIIYSDIMEQLKNDNTNGIEINDSTE